MVSEHWRAPPAVNRTYRRTRPDDPAPLDPSRPRALGTRFVSQLCHAFAELGGHRRTPKVAKAYEFEYRRRCAGINRHEGGDERALHRRRSEPRWPRAMWQRSQGRRRSVGEGYVQAGLLSHETNATGVPTPFLQSGRQHRQRRYASRERTPRGRRTPHARNLHAREPGDPILARCPQLGRRAAQGRLRSQA